MIAMSLHPTLSEVPLPIPCSFALVNFSAPGFRRNGTILRLRSIRHIFADLRVRRITAIRGGRLFGYVSIPHGEAVGVSWASPPWMVLDTRRLRHRLVKPK
jgi:hypothetical protein